MESEIDNLLERYLGLLDEYTKLRETLSATQRLMYQNIARANFSAERGMRYGPDHFDERMQALRKLRVESPRTANADTLTGRINSARFVVTGPESATTTTITPASKTHTAERDDDGFRSDVGRRADDKAADSENESGDTKTEAEMTRVAEKTASVKLKDPLHWFGLFTPAPLRSAQGEAVQLVEQIVPRLVTVMAEMADLEIEVRRTRKKRAKAAAKEKNIGLEEKSAPGPELAVS